MPNVTIDTASSNVLTITLPATVGGTMFLGGTNTWSYSVVLTATSSTCTGVGGLFAVDVAPPPVRRAEPLPPTRPAAPSAVVRENPYLTAAERRELGRRAYLVVRSHRVVGRTYRIPAAAHSEVAVYERGRLVERLCLQPANRHLAMEDWVALQKLLLVGDEEYYLATANHFDAREPAVERRQRAEARAAEVARMAG